MGTHGLGCKSQMGTHGALVRSLFIFLTRWWIRRRKSRRFQGTAHVASGDGYGFGIPSYNTGHAQEMKRFEKIELREVDTTLDPAHEAKHHSELYENGAEEA